MSNIKKINGSLINAESASYINPLQQNVIVTGSLTLSGSITASSADINNLYVTNLTAITSSIQYITSSQLNVGTNLITVNTNTSPLRFGGLAVADSGSSPIVSGSLLFDSINDQWIFVHQQNAGSPVTSSVLIMGPQTFNDVGNEITIGVNRLTKGQAGDLGEHITSSNISDDGTTVSINSNTEITGSLKVTAGVTASLQGTAATASFVQTAQTASYVLNAVSASYAPSAQPFPYTGSALITGSLGVTGSSSFVNNSAGISSPFKVSTIDNSNAPYLQTLSAGSISEASLIATRIASTGVTSTAINRGFLFLSNGAGYTNVISSNEGLAFSTSGPSGYDSANDQMRFKNGDLSIGTNYTGTARLNVSGSTIISQNLSIGTTLTTSPLTVISSASPLITIQSTTANSYSNMRFSGSGRSFTVGVGNASETTFGVANDFFIYDDTTGAMRLLIDPTGNVNIPGETASRILSTDASKNIKALDTTTYPSLTELSYVKGVTSAIQTQLGGKQDTLTNGYGITGTPTIAVSLTSTQVFATATTSISAATYADITGCSVSLAAGTWLITGHVVAAAANLITQGFVAIRDGANTVIAASALSRPASGTASVNAPFAVSWSALVTPAVTTTYKLSAARGLTTLTQTYTVYDGTGYNTTNHATDNSDKGTNILAIRIA